MNFGLFSDKQPMQWLILRTSVKSKIFWHESPNTIGPKNISSQEISSEYGQSRLQYKKNYGKHWMHVAMADDQYKLHKLGVPIQKICNFLNKKYGHRFSSRKTWHTLFSKKTSQRKINNWLMTNISQEIDPYSSSARNSPRLRWSVDRELDKIATDYMNCRFVRSRENTRKFEIIWSNSFCPETKRGKRILTS